MKPLKTIIACTDFSAGSQSATRYAAALAAAAKAGLVLLHVHYVQSSSGKAEDETASRARLLLSADELKKEFKIEIRTEQRSGLPVDEIISAARAVSADMIVTGAKDTPAGSGLVGGLVYDLMHASLFPVLAIPQTIRFQPLKNIALAIDPGNRDAFDDSMLRNLQHIFGSNLVLLHVQEKDSKDETKMQMATVAVEYRYAELMHRILLVENENLVSGLSALFENGQAELLAIIPHRHYFLDRMMRSTQTQKVLKKVHYPLLALPRHLS